MSSYARIQPVPDQSTRTEKIKKGLLKLLQRVFCRSNNHMVRVRKSTLTYLLRQNIMRSIKREKKRAELKNYKFAWFNIGCMIVLAAVIFINRGYKFFEARSWPGYIIYALFVLFALLAITSIVMTIIRFRRAGQ
jgi:hypothetical protein